MPVALHFKDLDTFDCKPIPGGLSTFKNWSSDTSVHLSHPKAGDIGMNVFALPHLQIMQVSWQTGIEPITVHGHDKTARSIGISFHLQGSMYTRFKGIGAPLEMKAGRHNLVYTPELGDEHTMAGRDSVDALQLNLDEDFFKSCIGNDTAWAEKRLHNLERQIPFSGVESSAETTPAMMQIIQSIIQLPQKVPMRNLLIQSRALELLALQFEQFAQVGLNSADVLTDDAEKLHQLKAFLDQHFLKELSLTSLSRKFCLNEFKVKKGFKQLFNDTVFGYVRRLRMEYAVRLLRDGNAGIDEVAYELGYEHPQHFSTAFRKFFGESPSIYTRRKQALVP